MNQVGTVALVISDLGQGPVLLEALSDDDEIKLFESTLKEGRCNPLSRIRQLRRAADVEDEEFGDYVEELLSKPFIQPEIQKNGLQWLHSKIKIDEYKKSEEEATRVIANYAYRIYQDNPEKKDFLLAGPKAQVRIRVFVVPEQFMGGYEEAA